MKFVVDNLPKTCEKCVYCADAMMMSPLGVQKPINICTIVALLVPQNPEVPPQTIDKTLSPVQNNCPCTDNKSTSSLVL